MKLISFIIPAHNCAATIENTVKSIETVQIDSEIIIVENGSSDDTSDVVYSLADQYKNIRLFTSDKGVSKARNKGIDVSMGDWIVFIDADDESLRGIETMREHLSMQCLDLIIGSYKKDNDIIRHDYSTMNTGVENTDELKSWLISRPTLRMQAWAKIYRTSFLKENKLRFNEDLSYSEDSEFVIRAIVKAQKVMITDVPFYHYHSGTISAMRGFVEGRIEKYITALEAAESDVEGESSVIKHAFIDYVIAHINIMGVHDVFGCEVKETWRNRCRKMRNLMQESVIERTLNGKSISKNLQSLPVLLCRYHLTALSGVIYYTRSLQNRKRYIKAGNYE